MPDDALPFLGRAQILAAEDLPFADVVVPAWGTTIRLRSLTAGEREEIERYMETPAAGASTAERRAHLKEFVIAMAAIDPATGAPLFQRDDVEALSRKAGAAIDLVFVAASRLSKLTKGDIDDLVKSSGAVPSGYIASPSPSASA